MDNILLQVRDLKVSFKTHAGISQAVRGLSFDLNSGETLAIVGESGCGKTVTSKAIMGLLPSPQTIIDRENASIEYLGENLLKTDEKRMSQIRGNQISMIFQDPMTSLNPTMRVGDQIAESMMIHRGIGRQEAAKQALEMLQQVRIPNAEKRLRQYPFEFSGGMRQRVMIAIALACRPKVLIADEPTTALDVTIQAQIMDLIAGLKSELDMGVILVTHDLGVVASVSDRVAVMYAGKMVETGTSREIFYSPRHPYTLALLQSVPRLQHDKREALYSLKGSPPDLTNPPEGCPFAARCRFGMGVCRVIMPDITRFSETHASACWLHHEMADRTGAEKLIS